MKNLVLSIIALIIAISILTSCDLRDVSIADDVPSLQPEITEQLTPNATEEPHILNPSLEVPDEFVDVVVFGKILFSISKNRLGTGIDNAPTPFGEILTEEECELIINAISGKWKLKKIVGYSHWTASGVAGFYEGVSEYVHEQLALPISDTILEIPYEGVDMSTAYIEICNTMYTLYSNTGWASVEGEEITINSTPYILVYLPLEINGNHMFPAFIAGSENDFYFTNNIEDETTTMLLWLLERVY